MTRPFLSGLLAATLALTSLGTAPAYAGNDDLKRILGGVATVIILGATYDHLRDKNRREQPATRRHDPQPDHRDRHDRDRHARIVPEQCLRTAETRQGTVRYFARPCLRQTMRNVNALPNACAFEVRERHNRPITGYAPRCLRDYGWRRG
jgi:hypothetical protein